MDNRKDSFQDPYLIIDIARIANSTTNNGRLAISLAPGKKDHRWNRDLQMDLARIKNDDIHVIVCCLEWYEIRMLNITDYPRMAQENGFIFYHLPIKDRDVPQDKELNSIIPIIVQHLLVGHNVLVHCRAGLGRAGTICACCLGHFGYTGTDAINLVRKQRPGAIQTNKQERYVSHYCLTINDMITMNSQTN